MLRTFRIHLGLILAVAFAAPLAAQAQAEPTLHQIYQAAETGHLDQAQQMVDQVLRAHPQSAKAHYVAAELYARERNLPAARQELSRAETLEPGLPFARADAAQRLRSELGAAQNRNSLGTYEPGLSASRAHSAVPWGLVLIIVAAVAVLWAVMRRRAAPAGYQQYPGGAMSPAGAPGYGPVPGPGYGPGYGGPGMGSGIAGGLASGLAVGAGVVAGEELAHRFLGGDREGVIVPPAEPDRQNSDMGGSDFGVSDGGSWDDGSVGGDISGGGDGGDWT